jgi:hypothetical protein
MSRPPSGTNTLCMSDDAADGHNDEWARTFRRLGSTKRPSWSQRYPPGGNSPLRRRSPVHRTESSTCSTERILLLCGRLPAQICTDLRLVVSASSEKRRTGDDSVDQDKRDRVGCDPQGNAQEFVLEVTKGGGGRVQRAPACDSCVLFAGRPAQGAVKQSARGISALAEEGDEGLTRQCGRYSGDVP